MKKETPDIQITKELLSFIQDSPSCYHVIENFRCMLKKAGFQEVYEQEEWKLKPGNGYFVTRGDSSLIAFRIPDKKFTNFQMIASHSDSPSFKIKENSEICVENKYVTLNVEKYGGMLMAPWFDRPLSVAGKAVVKGKDCLKTKLVSFDRDLVLIPNVAIHMNRKANDGYTYHPQKDLLPLFRTTDAEMTFEKLVAKQLKVSDPSDILATDLFLYNRMPGSIWGAEEEFASSPKLDDLQCAYSSMRAFLESQNAHSVTVCAVFDNEEVGSTTKQGADSTMLSDILERINFCLGRTMEEYQTAIAGSFLLSADNAHAVHPNHPEFADPTNRPQMNRGVVIKYNANQKYTTDAVSAAIFKSICEKAKVPYQSFTNHSDMAGGSTLGNIANAHVSLNTVDIGLAQLAMHSPYETAGVKDTAYMIRAMKQFYATHIEKIGTDKYQFQEEK
ncbi:MAG: M18 family aminopeptidase [Lachnospiraceae bacterium]